MLFFVELRHAPERCPGVAPEIRDRMLRMAQNRDQVLESHGCRWVGGWISPTPHLTFITLDAPGAHVVDSAMRDLGLATWNRTEIFPIITMEEAIDAVEQTGIVFLDELDKVAKRSEGVGADVSREGVQRDLLPLIEGSTINTKYGMVRTDHILFIASGAFHFAKPSDLIPELQGRLPIRVELAALTAEDFRRILSEPDASLTEQYKALLETEGVSIEFEDKALVRIAEIACEVNEHTENIGARRLHTVMERLLDEISFEAGDGKGSTVIDAAYVDGHLADIARDQDLSRYIL